MSGKNTTFRFIANMKKWLATFPCNLSRGILLWVLTFPAWANLDTPRNLDIKSQAVGDALLELGKQAEISIVFPANLPLDGMSESIQGSLTPRTALEILLLDQPVEWQAFNSRVVAIAAKPIPEKDKPIFQPTPLSEVIVIGEQVTGSRIKRLDWEGSAPVDIITRAEINARGVQAVSDYLRFIPAVSGNSTSTAVSNGGDGTATITLRGLPSANTLVLLDGRRIANSGFGADSVDLNSIPLAAVERIEVLKDGASAIYGSDAIAGVVNIILKKEYNGVLFDQYFSQTSRGDMSTSHTSFIAGFDTERASFMVTASHFDQDPIYSRDRKLSESADGRDQGGIDQRSSATPFSRITLLNDPNTSDDDEVVVLSEGSDPNLTTSYRPATENDLYNYRETTSSMSPSQRSSLFLSSIYDVHERSQITAHAGYTETESQVSFAPFPLFTAFEDPIISVSAQNPYNPFGVDIIDVRRRLVELGPRLQNSTEKAKRFSIVWENGNDNIHWDIAYNWSITRAAEEFLGILNPEHTRLALSADCITEPECIPLDVFGPPGSITSDQVNYIKSKDSISGVSKLNEITTNADTVIENWIAEPISIAGGISYRQESSKLQPIVEDLGNSKPPVINGNRTVFESYLEANVPLAMRLPFIYQLELELATRYSHYSDFGDTNNPKVGLRYRPLQDVLLRSTWTRGFRAPSLNQLNQDNKKSFDLLFDPCSLADNVGELPGCDQLSDPSLVQFLVETGGNKRLQPETSVSKTIGLVWTPKNWSELYFSVDWFWMEQKSIIGSRPQYILNQNATLNAFPGQVVRDAQGNITRIVANYINVGRLEVNGIDATFRYQLLNRSFGNLQFSINGSHIANYNQQQSPNESYVDLAGTFADQASDGVGAIPKLKLNAGIGWSNERWEFNYNIFYVDKLTEVIPRMTTEREIASWTTQNMQLNYLAGRLKNIRYAMGVDNITDRMPPFSASAFNDNYDPRTYEIKGRNWYAQVRFQF